MKTERTPTHAPLDAGCANDTARPSPAPPASARRRIAGPGATAALTATGGWDADWDDEETAASPGNVARAAAPRKPQGREFPTTKWTLVHAGAASPEALRQLCEAYYQPLLAFARVLEFDPERADDVVQGFLTSVLEQKVVDKADPTRGRFRTFLRQALRNYAINVHRAEKAGKRGGNARFVDSAFEEIASDSPAIDQLYDRAWARALLDRALTRLRDEQRSRPDKWAVYEALSDRLEGDDDGATLREAALRLGKSEGAMKLSLFRLRRRYFDLVRAEVGATVAGPDEVDPELRSLRAALRR